MSCVGESSSSPYKYDTSQALALRLHEIHPIYIVLTCDTNAAGRFARLGELQMTPSTTTIMYILVMTIILLTLE